MFNLFKKILPKKSALELTQNELEYKTQTLNQVNNLLEGALKNQPNGWEKLQPKLSAEIDEQILIARSLGKTPQQIEREKTDAFNAELERKRALIRNGYCLSVADYQKTIVPIFSKFDFFPEPDTVSFSGDSVGDLLYLVSNSDYRTSKDAQDSLMGFCDTDAVAEVAKAIRTTYELARRCESAGVSKARCVARSRCCDQCKAMDGKDLSVTAILDEFNAGMISFPHSLPSEDTANYCLGPNLIPLEI